MKKLISNGKNHKIFKFSVQNLMDLEPDYVLMTYPSIEEAKKFEEYMEEAPCSEITKLISELSPKEMYEERNSLYWKNYKEELDNLVCNAPQEFIDKYMSYLSTKKNPQY